MAIVVTALGWLAKLPSPPQIWPNRDSLTPSLMSRMEQAQTSLFLVGFSLETTFKDYAGTLARALIDNSGLHVRILMLHPDSLHVRAHQIFSTRPVAERIRGTVNGFLKELFDALTPEARHRLQVRATHYLPRFAARVFDDSTMLLNFYLFKSRAHENPVIELRRDLHKESFAGILRSLDELFHYGDTQQECNRPNHRIVENGRWYGLPKAKSKDLECD